MKAKDVAYELWVKEVKTDMGSDSPEELFDKNGFFGVFSGWDKYYDRSEMIEIIEEITGYWKK